MVWIFYIYVIFRVCEFIKMTMFTPPLFFLYWLSFVDFAKVILGEVILN
jgi:hypothetical protein